MQGVAAKHIAFHFLVALLLIFHCAKKTKGSIVL